MRRYEMRVESKQSRHMETYIQVVKIKYSSIWQISEFSG